MAYTYDDFVKAANQAGVMDRFSQSDLTTAQKNPEYGLSMVGLMQDISKATTAEQRLLANEAANQMRKNYGVYGTGKVGDAYSYASSYGSTIDDLMGQIKDYGSFDYANQDAYQQLLDSVANPTPFSYDYSKDPSYSAYKKAYLREGDRASANALAQASAASGGRTSSYAMTAANQAGNYYAGQLGDMIPTLEQNAYSRYLGDFNNRLSGLSALQSDRSFNYEKWMNEYNMLQNSLGNYQGQDATDYQRYLDAYNQAYQAEQDKLAKAQQQYENQQAAKQLEYENALALYRAMGYATPEVAKILGISAGTGTGGTTVGPAGGETGDITAPDAAGTVSWPKGIDETRNTSGLKGSAWDYTKNNIQQLIRAGNKNTVVKYVDQIIDQANEKQYSEIISMLENAGIRLDEDGSGGGFDNAALNNSGGKRVDRNSVLQLGYGPIDEDKLNELVEAGEVEEYVEGDVIKFRKVEKPFITSPIYDFTKRYSIRKP